MNEVINDVIFDLNQQDQKKKEISKKIAIMDSRKKMSFSSCSVEFIYMAASPPCRAVWMCIKELGIDVDMRHIDMYKKAEHTQPWFVKVSAGAAQ
jgi:hypothetical protein